MRLLYALILTIFIEAAAMFVLTRSAVWVFYNLLCNLVTNPILNLLLAVLMLFTDSAAIYYAALALGEGAVLAAEAKIYRLLSDESYPLCFRRSLITNLLSFLLGSILL